MVNVRGLLCRVAPHQFSPGDGFAEEKEEGKEEDRE